MHRPARGPQKLLILRGAQAVDRLTIPTSTSGSARATNSNIGKNSPSAPTRRVQAKAGEPWAAKGRTGTYCTALHPAQVLKFSGLRLVRIRPLNTSLSKHCRGVACLGSHVASYTWMRASFGAGVRICPKRKMLSVEEVVCVNLAIAGLPRLLGGTTSKMGVKRDRFGMTIQRAISTFGFLKPMARFWCNLYRCELGEEIARKQTHHVWGGDCHRSHVRVLKRKTHFIHMDIFRGVRTSEEPREEQINTRSI